MRNLTILLSIIFFCFAGHNLSAQVYEPIGTPKIKDGNYNAIVKYHNYSTNTVSNYELVVTVKNERVIALHFPNEGSIHSGQNNSGYLFSGGNLIKKLGYDRSGNSYIKSATASIQVRYTNGTTVGFTVSI